MEDWRQQSSWPQTLAWFGPREFDRGSFGMAFGSGNLRAARLFWLLADDMDSLEFVMADFQRVLSETQKAALDAFDNPRASNPRRDWASGRELFHHAKVFVCIMRRFWRLLDAAYNQRAQYPRPIANVVKLAWHQHRAFFENYRWARDAIEHINGEIADGSKRIPEGIWGGSLKVVDGAHADVTTKALGVACSIWEELAKAAYTESERVRASMLWRARLLHAMQHQISHAGR